MTHLVKDYDCMNRIFDKNRLIAYNWGVEAAWLTEDEAESR